MLVSLVAITVTTVIIFTLWQIGHIDLILPEIRWLWLAFFPLVPRLALFYYDSHILLVTAQLGSLVFLLVNFRVRGLMVLALGSAANALVASVNGGFMPVDAKLMPYLYSGNWQTGDVIGWSVILPANEIKLYWLSDWILIEAVSKAYSPGDFLILAGAFLFLFGCVRFEKHTQ